MSSAKEDGAAAAAEQLGCMSLGGSVEGEPTPTQKLCSACGKKSDTLKKCTACKCVWYCDKKCQNKHRKEHKRECRPIKTILDDREGKVDFGTEVDLGPLPDLPPQEECPICMRVMPIHRALGRYNVCCGKFLCGGCDFQHQMKSAQQAAERGQTPAPPPTCAFCREPNMRQSEEVCLSLLIERVKRNDPRAMHHLALDHGYGDFGLSVDEVKCIDLLRQSACLGFPPAQAQLGDFHHFGEMGLEKNEEEALMYWREAAEGGHFTARHNIGSTKDENGDHVAAMRHWRLSASGGYRHSMVALIECFKEGWLQHKNLAETIQAFYRSRDEMKSEDRVKYIAYLKMTGEYEEEYDK